MEPFSTDQTQRNNKRTLKDAPQQILGQLQSITERGKNNNNNKNHNNKQQEREDAQFIFLSAGQFIYVEVRNGNRNQAFHLSVSSTL